MKPQVRRISTRYGFYWAAIFDGVAVPFLHFDTALAIALYGDHGLYGVLRPHEYTLAVTA